MERQTQRPPRRYYYVHDDNCVGSPFILTARQVERAEAYLSAEYDEHVTHDAVPAERVGRNRYAVYFGRGETQVFRRDRSGYASPATAVRPRD